MRYLRPIPKRLLPDEMLVYPPDGRGGYLSPLLVRHVRFEAAESVSMDAHRSADGGSGRVFVDAVNSEGAFEVAAGSRVVVGPSPSMWVVECRRCCVVRGHVHHWELTVR